MTLGETVFVRADAGVAIGMGHIRRCEVLSWEIAKYGAKVILLTRREPDVTERDYSWSHKTCWMNGCSETLAADDEEESDANWTVEAIERLSRSRSWVILDSGRLGHRWEKAVRSTGHNLLVIDDYRCRKHCADIIVSDSRMPLQKSLIGFNPASRQLCGRKYAIVDGRFSLLHKAGLPIRAPKNVLISYGGSDPTNETAKAVKAVLSLQKIMPFDLRFGRIDIVIGPLNPRASAIIAAAKEVTGAVIHHDPPCLAPLMRDADICLTAGGNTLIEALVMHKCCIVTTTAENQEVIVDELLEEGSIVSLGRSTDVTMQDMATAIAEALRSYKKKAMRPVIGYDQFGASRIVQEMSRYSLHSTPMPL